MLKNVQKVHIWGSKMHILDNFSQKAQKKCEVLFFYALLSAPLGVGGGGRLRGAPNYMTILMLNKIYA